MIFFIPKDNLTKSLSLISILDIVEISSVKFLHKFYDTYSYDISLRF